MKKVYFSFMILFMIGMTACRNNFSVNDLEVSENIESTNIEVGFNQPFAFDKSLAYELNNRYTIANFEKSFGYADEYLDTSLYGAKIYLIYNNCTYKGVYGRLEIYLSDKSKLVAYKFNAKAEGIQDDFINEEVNDIYTVLGDRKIDKSEDNIIKFSFLGSKVGCGNVCLNKEENDLFILIYSLEDTQEAIKKYEQTEPYNPEIGMSKEEILASA